MKDINISDIFLLIFDRLTFPSTVILSTLIFCSIGKNKKFLIYIFLVFTYEWIIRKKKIRLWPKYLKIVVFKFYLLIQDKLKCKMVFSFLAPGKLLTQMGYWILIQLKKKKNTNILIFLIVIPYRRINFVKCFIFI